MGWVCSVHDNICHVHNVVHAAFVSANNPAQLTLWFPTLFALRLYKHGGDIVECRVEYPTGLGLTCAEPIIPGVKCRVVSMRHVRFDTGR